MEIGSAKETGVLIGTGASKGKGVLKEMGYSKETGVHVCLKGEFRQILFAYKRSKSTLPYGYESLSVI